MNSYTVMRNGWTEEAFIRFWHRMGETFGKSWYDSNGPEINASWKASLVGLALDTVARTLEHYRTSGDAFAPNLSQFMAAARQFKSAPAHVALPAPEHIPEKIKRGIDSIRNVVKSRKLRSILIPNEGFGEYQDALLASGKKKEDFDRSRLEMNEWTDEDEKRFRFHATNVGRRVA